jgi:hypothetical protein
MGIYDLNQIHGRKRQCHCDTKWESMTSIRHKTETDDIIVIQNRIVRPQSDT